MGGMDVYAGVTPAVVCPRCPRRDAGLSPLGVGAVSQISAYLARRRRLVFAPGLSARRAVAPPGTRRVLHLYASWHKRLACCTGNSPYRARLAARRPRRLLARWGPPLL